MATKTFEELKQLAIQIRDEKTNKQNTATRIGTQMLEHLDKLEQDYYDKTATDEELKERDEKLTELAGNIFGIPIFSIGGIDANTGNSVVNKERVRTDDFYRVDYNLTSDVDIIAYLYDNQKTYLGYVSSRKKQTSETALQSYPTAKFAKFSVNGLDYNISGYAVGINNIITLKNDINALKIEGEEIKQQTFGVPIFSKGGIDASTGNNADNSDRVRTNNFYKVDYNLKSDTTIIVYLYDKDQAYLGYISANYNQKSETALSTYPSAKLAKFSITKTEYMLSGYAYLANNKTLTELGNDIEELSDKVLDTKNILYGNIIPINLNDKRYWRVGGISSSDGTLMNDKTRLNTCLFHLTENSDLKYSRINTDVSVSGYISIYDANKKYLGYESVKTLISDIISLYPMAYYFAKTLILSENASVDVFSLNVKMSENIYGTIRDFVIEAPIEDMLTNAIPSFVTGGIDANTGNYAVNTDRVYTPNYYSAIDYMIRCDKDIIAYLYDSYKTYLGYISTAKVQSSDMARSKYPECALVRFSVTSTDISSLTGYVKKKIQGLKSLNNRLKTNSNGLEGLIWAYCGDSFSYGGYSNSEITDADKMPQDSMYAGQNKVYGYIIADRNNMILQNMSMGGRTLATPADGSFTNAFTNINNQTSNSNYKQIREDANIATFYFGINDSHHRPGSSGGDGEDNTGEIEVGTIDDETENTFYGAWNVMLKWVVENRPFTKLGIIVSNGCETDEYRIATIAIAKKWGIPYIDLNGDERTPMMLRSTNPNISSIAKNARLNSQRISFTNSHPNTQAHEYESTFIENFLRSL